MDWLKKKEDKAGLYITIIIHLVIAIVLLSSVVTPSLKGQLDIEIDYSEQDKLEELQKELEIKKRVNERLKQLLGEEYEADPVKNVAVDNEMLKDAKGIDAEKLYEDARRVQQDFEEIQNRKDEVYSPEISDTAEKEKEPQKQNEIYTGPAVVSYSLPGRKASYIPSPAYKCIGAGEVTVSIGVHPNGSVETVKILEDVSSADQCLREFALNAARRTRFNQVATVRSRQFGTIVYTFIAQ